MRRSRETRSSPSWPQPPRTSEPAAIEALDELLRLDLVRDTDVPRRFRFRHPLVRRAVYEATPGGWRLGAHERSRWRSRHAGASVTARAHHVERSARQGDAAAVAVLREAGDAAAQRAPASAARWFEGALRLLPESAPAEERVELLLALVRALGATGQFAESHAALLESMKIVPGGSARPCAYGSPSRAPGSSSSWAVTRRRTPGSRARWPSSRTPTRPRPSR